MTKFRFGLVVVLSLSVVGMSRSTALAQVSYTSGTYSQNFDTLITTGTGQPWTNNTTLPGWSLFRAPAPGTAITTYNAGDGGVNTGSFYSFGTGTTTERALGGTASGGAYFGSPATGAVAGWIAVGVTNSTGGALTSVTVNYDGEQWRNGGNTTAQAMVLEYGVGASFLSVATWTPAGAGFNFTSLVNTATAAALDGNLPANRTADLGGTIDLTSTPLADGETIWFRWIENNDAGNDHGLAVDNFVFSTTPVPEPGSVLALAAGAVGLGGYVRRRLRKPAA